MQSHGSSKVRVGLRDPVLAENSAHETFNNPLTLRQVAPSWHPHRDRQTSLRFKTAQQEQRLPQFDKFAEEGPGIYASYIDEPLLYVDNETPYYVHSNDLYSVAALTDATGAVVERYNYDAYGRQAVGAADGTVRMADLRDATDAIKTTQDKVTEVYEQWTASDPPGTIRAPSPGGSSTVSIPFPFKVRGQFCLKCHKGFKEHQVQPGDTLWSLWEQRRDKSVTWGSMIEHNIFINNPDKIYPGDYVCVPKCGARQ